MRAIRWASDRIGDAGVVAFVTNGYFIDGRSQDGLRKSLVDEFSHIYCLNLRGNQRGVQGDLSRREGGKVFGGGSRAPVAITLLIRDGSSGGPAQLRYHDIGDYLTREDKFARLVEFAEVGGVPWQTIVPNDDGDWIHQRDTAFNGLLVLGDKSKAPEPAVFKTYAHGLSTGRDAWVYNFDSEHLLKHVRATASLYNTQAREFAKHVARHPSAKPKNLVEDFIDKDARKISWTRALKQRLARSPEPIVIEQNHVAVGAYRPFCKQRVYMDPDLNEVMSLQPAIFPPGGPPNLAVVTTGPGARREFSALMVDAVPNLHHQDSGQSFPRYTFERAGGQGSLLDGNAGSYVRTDNIAEAALQRFREHYEDPSITADEVFFYIYAALHSPTYRQRFASELRRALARVPLLEDFDIYTAAGRELSDLHVGYEHVAGYGLDEVPTSSVTDPKVRYRVEKMRFGTGKDRTTIVYNTHLTLAEVPGRAFEYEVNGRPAIEWIIDRYQVRTDKDSGIVNDPNTYSEDPRYIVDLLRRMSR